MPIYLACGPEELAASLPALCRPARLGFHLAVDYPSLLGPEVPAQETGSFLVLHDDVLPPYEPTAQLAAMIVTLCAELRGGLICDFHRTPTPFWQQLTHLLDEQAAYWSVPLLVPEAFAAEAQQAQIVVPLETGATPFAQQAQAAAATYPQRAVLQLQPLGLDVALPGHGAALTSGALQTLLREKAPAVFHDDALICDYFGYLQEKQLHLVLFDTAQTLAEKQRQADAAGCVGAFGLYQQWGQYL